jgi:hypothetical protein
MRWTRAASWVLAPRTNTGLLIGKRIADKRLARHEANLDGNIPRRPMPNGPRCNVDDVLPRFRWDFPAASTGKHNFPATCDVMTVNGWQPRCGDCATNAIKRRDYQGVWIVVQGVYSFWADATDEHFDEYFSSQITKPDAPVVADIDGWWIDPFMRQPLRLWNAEHQDWMTSVANPDLAAAGNETWVWNETDEEVEAWRRVLTQ